MRNRLEIAGAFIAVAVLAWLVFKVTSLPPQELLDRIDVIENRLGII